MAKNKTGCESMYGPTNLKIDCSFDGGFHKLGALLVGVPIRRVLQLEV